MNRAQRELAATVRAELVSAVDSAAAEQAHAEAARARAGQRAEAAERTLAALTETLTVQREGDVQDATARFVRDWSATGELLAGRTAAVTAQPAGAPWADWPLTVASQATSAPLTRIGMLSGTPAPALIPLLDNGHLHVDDPHGRASALIPGVLLRILAGARPGLVNVVSYDPEHLGRPLGGFSPLAGAGLSTLVGPGGLTTALDEAVEHLRRINHHVLAGEYGSLAELAGATGRRPEPWRLLVLIGDTELTAAQRAQLDRIVRIGAAGGVHILSYGLALGAHPSVTRLSVAADGTASSSMTLSLPIRLDSHPGADLISTVCRAIADQAALGPPPAAFADILPEKWWIDTAAHALTTPVGEGPDGRLVELTLGDDPPHALIGGPSGSGKTNLIYVWLAGLAARYSPDELGLYLLDFKEGVSFARFAPQGGATWLPHVRLIGVNVNTDREFGIALLRFLRDELRRRAEAAKRVDATKLAELRAEDPGGHWPRLVAVVDEFQVLLAGRDALAAEAVALLEDLARRGRSQGIHLILASQDISGIEALWGRAGLIGQFTLRIALPKARRVLADTNLAAEAVARHHAVVNADSGTPGANRVVRVPEASGRQSWRTLQEELWRRRGPESVPPRLFDGDARPELPEPAGDGQHAILGELIDVAGRPAAMRFWATPGRNLAVLGAREADAHAVLAAAAVHLARDRTARFTVACLDEQSIIASVALADRIGAEWCDQDGLVDRLAAALAEPGPHYLILYAVDAAHTRLSAKRPDGGTGLDLLRVALTRGPEQRLHLLGWWRSVARLRDDLGGLGARFDAIGAWVALDVHGNELAPLTPQPGGPAWYPRPHRALFFDRAVHRTPEVIVPYRVEL